MKVVSLVLTILLFTACGSDKQDPRSSEVPAQTGNAQGGSELTEAQRQQQLAQLQAEREALQAKLDEATKDNEVAEEQKKGIEALLDGHCQRDTPQTML